MWTTGRKFDAHDDHLVSPGVVSPTHLKSLSGATLQKIIVSFTLKKDVMALPLK